MSATSEQGKNEDKKQTDIERLVETFEALGIPFKKEELNNETVPHQYVQINADSHGGDGFPGYHGFHCVFGFDKDGKFVRDESGVWE